MILFAGGGKGWELFKGWGKELSSWVWAESLVLKYRHIKVPEVCLSEQCKQC
jgi:hypothetical protein